MTKLADIPVKVIGSGEKYQSNQGITAIRDGIKANPEQAAKPRLAKPKWLKMQAPSSVEYKKTRDIVKSHGLSTVCEEAKCPNIGECWSHGTATIMLLGSICTRACKFCAVDTGNPHGYLDAEEPKNAAKSVQLMNLKYIVLTSVDRDDLEDGGAGQYAETIREIKNLNPKIKVEALVPDFQGKENCVDMILASGADVFAQNIETVKRLTHPVRDPRASYEQTLKVLEYAKKSSPKILTKTSLMLGLGETEAEIKETLEDLKAINCDIVTFGQYLQPTKNHLRVEKYVTPEEFMKYREWGLEMGFLEVVSGPLVRSSYRADRVFEKDNVGL